MTASSTVVRSIVKSAGLRARNLSLLAEKSTTTSFVARTVALPSPHISKYSVYLRSVSWATYRSESWSTHAQHAAT